MTTLRGFWRNIRIPRSVEEQVAQPQPATPADERAARLDLDIAPNDPLLAYLQHTAGVVDVDLLQLESPALGALREVGVKLVVPLISQGELVGLVNLGPRLSEQEYSSDDRKLLNDLATQAAPALRVAQLARQQQLEAAERERMEHELRVARLIQQTLLPQEVPDFDGWSIAAHYGPARAVGGDFYDFIYFPDGKLGLIIGDVTDKGVPAALVMATTRSILRAAAERLEAPGAVLQRTNDVLYDDIPPKMFVTCLYAVLDPQTGYMRYANAGHDLPYRRGNGGVEELRATGMPLGLMPGMHYEEKEVTLQPGDTVLLYSDGLVEAHNPQREMFGFPRLQQILTGAPETGLTIFLLETLAAFTGPGWEQEDDVTLVTIQCEHLAPRENGAGAGEELLAFSLPSAPGNEREAMARVATAVAGLTLAAEKRERLKTAVAEATMNAMEHGNKYRQDVPVQIEVVRNTTDVTVRITDRGGGAADARPVAPDLAAKLAGEQSPRGWGLFLIQNMVDEMRTHAHEDHHTIELVMRLQE